MCGVYGWCLCVHSVKWQIGMRKTGCYLYAETFIVDCPAARTFPSVFCSQLLGDLLCVCVLPGNICIAVRLNIYMAW